MEKWLERLEQKLDALIDSEARQQVDIAEIKKDLAYHIKRTDLLENEVKDSIVALDRLKALKWWAALTLFAAGAWKALTEWFSTTP